VRNGTIDGEAWCAGDVVEAGVVEQVMQAVHDAAVDGIGEVCGPHRTQAAVKQPRFGDETGEEEPLGDLGTQ
jgi:hypothetical protein